MAEDADRREAAPFFVVGSDRSGTTMLRLMLNEHGRLHIPNESWFLTDLMDQLPLAVPLSEAQVGLACSLISGHWRWKEWGVGSADLYQAIHSIRSPTLGELVSTVFAQMAARYGKSRWGDKTPGYLTEISRLAQVFPAAKFLHIIRDGRDVCLSLRRTGWRGNRTWQIARYWADAVRRGCMQGRALQPGRYLEVRYEELVQRTEQMLERVCGFLGEPYEDAMREFYQHATDHLPPRDQGHLQKTRRAPRESDVDRWRKEMPWHQVLIFESLAARTMELVGQARRFRGWLAAVRVAVGGLEWMASVTLPVRRRIGLHFPMVRKLV